MPLLEVKRGLSAGYGNSQPAAAWLTTMGQLVVVSFQQAMLLDGRGFQVRAGTLTTPLVGDIVITDTAAEMCADVASGTTMIPFSFGGSIRLATGTLHEYALKAVATVSSAGTAFTPLPLKSNGAAAVSTARVTAAGGVTVTAELATTTLRLWEYGGPTAAAAAEFAFTPLRWDPIAGPVLVGARCFYVQIAATGTGPSYYAHFDYIEVPTLMIDPS